MNALIGPLLGLCILSPVKEVREGPLANASFAFQLRVSAVMAIESQARPDLVSSAGAVGPMQLMPIAIRELQTADAIPDSCRPPLQWRTKAASLYHGTLWGACYLQHLERLGYRGVEQLVAYNAGPGRVRRWRRTGRLPLETSNYIRKVTAIEQFCMENIQ